MMRLLFILVLLIISNSVYANSDATKKFIACATARNIECMKEALNDRANHKAFNKNGRAAIHILSSSSFDSKKALKFLLEHDSSIEHLSLKTNETKNTALHQASISNSPAEIMEVILNAAGTNKDDLLREENSHNETPLEFCVSAGSDPQAIAVLVKANPKQSRIINHYNKYKDSAFESALINIRPEPVIAIFTHLSNYLKVEALHLCYEKFRDNIRCEFFRNNIHNLNNNQNTEAYNEF